MPIRPYSNEFWSGFQYCQHCDGPLTEEERHLISFVAMMSCTKCGGYATACRPLSDVISNLDSRVEAFPGEHDLMRKHYEEWKDKAKLVIKDA